MMLIDMHAQNETIRDLLKQVRENPRDCGLRLVLADAVQETGDDAAADSIRREAGAIQLRMEEAESLRTEVRKLFQGSCEVFTIDTAEASNGYAARAAEAYLAKNPEILVYVYGDTAVTKSGLRKSQTGKIMYHRKSTGGRWGRSVQMHRVTI